MRSGCLSVRLLADGVCVFRNATRRRTVAAVSAVFLLIGMLIATIVFTTSRNQFHSPDCVVGVSRTTCLLAAPMHARTYHGLGTLSEALAWRWGFSFQGTQTRFFWHTAASLMNHCYHLLCSKKQSAIQIVLAFTITDGAFSTSKMPY